MVESRMSTRCAERRDDMKASADDLICDGVSEEIIAVTERLAMHDGAAAVTVRRVLKEMNVTNRVFYNRFHNISEVLETIYKRTVLKMRESLVSDFDIRSEFFEYVLDVCDKVLVMTYDLKNEFSDYMFEMDSSTEANRNWWMEKIKDIIAEGVRTNQIKDVDAENLSYTVWCFIRGFTTDAIKRKIGKKEAQAAFRFGFGCLLDGLKK